MSTTIDEKVVSLQFDNSRFERNVQTSMNTLNKLNSNFEQTEAAGYKAGLHLSDIWAKTSSVFEYQVARKISNALTKVAKSFTIDPIKSGLSEYEMKMNSVQTIMMSTGESVEKVNEYLNELNKYSDETIYSFQDMTSNIGKFTNAGVKLEDAVAAIKGISNEAAVSGANANEASRAMYNFSQALSAGYVKLIDWKSIENANMATMEFKQQLIDTAVEVGTLTKAEDGMYNTGKNLISSTKNFNDSLQDQWMTSEVLIQTLQKYADKETDIGKKAYEAATKVKTFSQMMDVLKETAQSGWARTWELIFGDLEQAKALFTPMTEFFGNIIEGIDDVRNGILETVLGTSNPLSKFSEKFGEINEAVGVLQVATKDYHDIVDKVINGDFGNEKKRFDALTEAGYDWAKVQNLVNEKLGSSTKYTERFGEVQNEMAKTLSELTDEELKNYGFTEAEVKVFRELANESLRTGKSMEELIKADSRFDAGLSGRQKLIDAIRISGHALYGIISQLTVAWNEMFPNSQDAVVNALTKAIDSFYDFAQKIGFIKEEISDTGEITRTIEFTEAFCERLEQVKDVLKGVFAAIDIVRMVLGAGLKVALTVVNKLLSYFNLDILKLASIIGKVLVRLRDLIKEANVIGRSVDFVFGKIEKLIGIIKNLWDSFSSIPMVSNVLTKLKDGFKDIVEIGKFVVEGFINGFSDKASETVNVVTNFGKKVLETIRKIFDIHSPSKVTFALGAFVALGFILGFKNILDSFDPSSTIGQVYSKIKDVVSGMEWGDSFSGVFEGIKNFFSKLDFGTVLAGGVSIVIVKNLVNFLKTLTSAIGGLGSVGKGVGKILSASANVLNKSAKSISKVIASTTKVIKASAKVVKAFAKVVKSFSKVLNSCSKAISAYAKKLKSEAFLNYAEALKGIAVAVGIITLSMIALALAINYLGEDGMTKLRSAVDMILQLTVVLGLFALVCSNFCDSGMDADLKKGKIKIKTMSLTLFGIAAAISAMVAAIAILGHMTPEELEQGKETLGLMMACIGGIIFIFGNFVSDEASKNIGQVGKMVKKLAVSLLLMTVVMKIIGHMSPDELTKGGTAIGIFTAIVAAMALITKVVDDKGIKKLGSLMLKLAGAMLIMSFIVTILGGMDPAKLGKGLGVLGGFSAIFALLALITKIIKKPIMDNLGKTLGSMAASMLMLALVLRIVGGMDPGNIIKGELALAGFAVLIGIMGYIVKKLGQFQGPKIAGTLLAMSVSIGILAAIAVALSLVDPKALMNGVIAVGVLGLVVAAMVKATKGAQNCMKNLIVMTIAIGVIAGCVAALSLIPSEKLMPAVVALGAVMLAFSAILFACAAVGKNGAKALLGVAIMAGVVGALAGVAYILYNMQGVQNAQQNAIALGGLLLVMSACMVSLGLIGLLGPKALIGVAALTLMCVPLAGIAFVLCSMQGFQAALSNVIALSALLVVMTACMVPLGLIGLLGASALIGVAALTLMCVPLAGIAFVLCSMQGVQNAITNAIGLGVLLTTMSLCLVPLTLVGAFGVAAIIGIGVLMVFIAAVGALIVGIGALMEKFPKLEEFIDRGLPILNKLGQGLGEFASGIVSGFLNGLDLSNLENLSTQLSNFMDNLQPFIDGAKNITKEALVGVGNLALIIAEITGANIIDAVGKFFSRNNSLSDLGTELETFGQSLSVFSNSINGLNLDKTQSVVDTVKKFGELGDESDSIVKLSKKLNELQSVDASKVESFKSAVNSLANIHSVVDTVKKFGELGDESDSIVKLSKNLNKLQSVDSSKIESFKSAVNSLATSDLKGLVTAFNEAATGSQLAGIKIIDNIVSSMSVGKSTVLSTAKDIASSIEKSFTDAYDKFEKVGQDLMAKVCLGIGNRKSNVNTAAKDTVSDASQKIRDKYSKFKSAGEYLAEGLAAGIKSGTNEAVAAAEAMANAVEAITRKVFKIASPSKVFKEDGEWVAEGLAVGVTDGTASVLKSVATLCARAKSEATRTLLMNTNNDDIRNAYVDYIKDTDFGDYGYLSGAFATYAGRLSEPQALDDLTEKLDTAKQKMIEFTDQLYLQSDAYKEEQEAAEANLANISNYTKMRLRNTRDLGIELGLTEEQLNEKDFDIYAYAATVVSGLSDAEQERKDKLQSYINTENSYVNSIESEQKAYNANATTLAENIKARDEEAKKNAELKEQYEAAKLVYESTKEAVENLSAEAQDAAGNQSKLSWATNLWNKITKKATDTVDGLTDAVDDTETPIDYLTQLLGSVGDKTTSVFTTILESYGKVGKLTDEEMDEMSKEFERLEKEYRDSSLELAHINDNILDQEEKIATQRKEVYQKLYADIVNKTEDFMDVFSVKYSNHITDLFTPFSEIKTEDLKTPFDILEAMQSQVDGVKKWQEDIKELSRTKISEGLLEYIKNLGPSAINEVQAFLDMTDDQILEANGWYAVSVKMTGTALLESYEEQAEVAEEWADNIAKVVAAGFDEDLVQEIIGKGVNEGNEFMKALLALDPEEIVRFNEARQKALSIPEEVANSVTASLAKSMTDINHDAYTNAEEEISGVGEDIGDTVIDSACDAIENGDEKIAESIVTSITDAAKEAKAEIKTETLYDGLDNKFQATAKGLSETITTNTSSSLTIKEPSSFGRVIRDEALRMNENNRLTAIGFAGVEDAIREATAADSNKEVALYVDGKKLATTIAGSMNRALNTIYMREAHVYQ